MFKAKPQALHGNAGNPRQLTTFDVRVHRVGGPRYIGQVAENNEELARLAALSRYGVAEEDLAPGTEPNGDAIFPEEDFAVSRA